MTDRVYLVHDVTRGSTEVPDLPDVLADYARRGWHPAPRPLATFYVPAPDGSGPLALDPALYTPQRASITQATETQED